MLLKSYRILKCYKSGDNREYRLFVKRLDVGIPYKGTCRRCFLHDPSNVNRCGDNRGDNRVKYFYYYSGRKINIVNLCANIFGPVDKYIYIMTSIK